MYDNFIKMYEMFHILCMKLNIPTLLCMKRGDLFELIPIGECIHPKWCVKLTQNSCIRYNPMIICNILPYLKI